MGRRNLTAGITAALVTALSVVVFAASPSSAAVKGTLHIQYDVDGTFKKRAESSSRPRTSDATINWKVSSDIPLAGSQVAARYSDRNSKQGSVNATATWTN